MAMQAFYRFDQYYDPYASTRIIIELTILKVFSTTADKVVG